jgi:KDO2-lipid IV(A) lauroyltransferase
MANRSEFARRRRRYLGYPLEAAFLYLIYGIFMVLPLDTASALGGWIGRTVGPRLGTSRKARRNLERAMPELPAERREEILRGMWDNLGRVMAEYPHLDETWKRTEMIGAEIVRGIAASKTPTLFFSAHTGNWEVGLLGAARNGLPVTAVYRRPNNPAVSWLINKARSVIGSRMVPKGRDGAREVVATLRNQGAVCIMIDQKMNDGIPVPFFGRDAMTAPAIGQLAFKYDCAVVPVFVERLEGAHFRLTISPPLELNKSGDRNADVRALMVRINEMVESRVRARPEQWLWLHRRWPD